MNVRNESAKLIATSVTAITSKAPANRYRFSTKSPIHDNPILPERLKKATHPRSELAKGSENPLSTIIATKWRVNPVVTSALRATEVPRSQKAEVRKVSRGLNSGW